MADNARNLLLSIIPTVRIIGIILQGIDQNTTGVDDAAGSEALAFVNAAQAYVDSFPQTSLPVRGYEQIKAFTDNVKNSFALVVSSDTPKTQKLVQAQILADSLTDDSLVYPARKGKDGELLQKTIRDIQAQLEVLRNS